MTTPPFDLLTMGRVSVDLYPEQSGVSLAEVRTFAKSLGGSPTNVAVAAARLGREAAVITQVGMDGFGPYVRNALRAFGVDDRFVGTDPELRTPVVFCELHPPDHFPLLFYREPKAPDLNLRPDDFDLDEVARVPLFWTSGTALSQEPSRSSTLAALAARRGGITVHDLDYRPMFWPSRDEARRLGREAVRHATVAVGNLEEVSVVVGDLEPDEAAQELLGLGPDLAIVKLGPRGVLARSSSGERCVVPPVEIEVVNGLGAGDAFGGALCHGLLSGWELERTIRFANAAGAIVAGRLGCADDMPTLDEVAALL
jgi:5-dehydro-2-deoxygluconokinase